MAKVYIPSHVAIIPDGNRRWAKAKGRPAFEGHRYAAQTVLKELIDESLRLKIKYFTFWALSTENVIGRSKTELDNLYKLIRFFLKYKLNEFKKKGIRFKTIGNIMGLPKDLQKEIYKVTKDTESNEKMTVIFGLNYGGRDEIIRAIKQNQNITKENLSDCLDTRGIPDPDLIVRTGGEKRLSGFMLWQSEYSELYFSDLLFPDFTAEEFKKAVISYSERHRRFGK